MSAKPIYPAVVIHHTTLTDMLQAIPLLAPVYADRYDRSHREYQHLITHTIIVCVRTYVRETGIIHSHTPYHAQTMRHVGEETNELDRLWHQAAAVLADISTTIAKERRVYRGILDLGPIEAVPGERWQIHI